MKSGTAFCRDHIHLCHRKIDVQFHFETGFCIFGARYFSRDVLRLVFDCWNLAEDAQGILAVRKYYARQYLLSHGISPHYHRRETFSLLSSRWIQVVPVCYCRRANRLTQHHLRTSGSENKLVVKVRYALVNIQPLEQLECYMVKPHGQLVRVSLMHYCTSTSRLSTL